MFAFWATFLFPPTSEWTSSLECSKPRFIATDVGRRQKKLCPWVLVHLGTDPGPRQDRTGHSVGVKPFSHRTSETGNKTLGG